jgi:antitoxin component YwqK of YwqJK toxin-antitoxin module
MVLRENYTNNLREGASIKYHWNGNIAEELVFLEDKRVGEWRQFYTDGVLALTGIYTDGKLNGPFEAFTVTGEPMIRGNYKNDVRDGEWLFWNNDGSFRRTIIYHDGIPENNAELIMEESRLLDELEKKGGLIEDPAKKGVKW